MSQAPTGYSIDALARAVGVKPRSIRYWVRRGVLPKPKFRGRATVYPLDCVERVALLRQMQAAGVDLREIRRRLFNATAAEIVEWGRAAQSGQPAAVVAAAAPSGAAPLAQGPTLAPVPSAAAADAGPRAARWDRWELLPGLELHVREGSAEVIRDVAREIALRYGAMRARG